MSGTTAEPGGARLLAVVCIAFLALGMTGAAIGPALPDIARQTQASTVAVGGMFTALFGGALGGQTAAGLLLRRIGHRRVLLAGMGICTVGATMLVMSASLLPLLAATAFLGLGFGFVTVTGNVVAAEAAQGAGPLNFVNAMYGIGAIVSPALVGLSIVAFGNALPVLWVLPNVMLVGVLLLLFWVAEPGRPLDVPPRVLASAPGGTAEVLRSPLLWIICGFVFAYISLEATIGGWLPTLLQHATDLPPALGAMAASWFYLVLTLVRLVAAWASGWISSRATLRACVGLCTVGAALLLTCAALGSQVLGFVATGLLGLSIGPIIATVIAILRSSFQTHAGLATGVVFSVGSVGGAVMPWAIGALIVNVGAVAGTVVLLVLPIVMGALLVLIEIHARRPPRRAEEAIAPSPLPLSEQSADGA